MMEMNTYIIRVTTIDNLYADYVVEAKNLFYAKVKVREAFFKDYPEADTNINLSLATPTEDNVKEIINLIKEAK